MEQVYTYFYNGFRLGNKCSNSIFTPRTKNDASITKNTAVGGAELLGVMLCAVVPRLQRIDNISS